MGTAITFGMTEGVRSEDGEEVERPSPMTREEPCLGLLARDKGSRQTRPPFEVVPAGDSTAATHVRQRKTERRKPDGRANCVEGALLRQSEAKHFSATNRERGLELGKQERRSRKRTRK